MPTPAHLEPSQLGTKEYWDSLYTTELANHAADSSDIGTCWFDDSDAQARILRLLRSLTSDPFSDSDSESSSPAGASGANSKSEGQGQNGRLRPQLDRESTSFLDLGCGNGALLFALRSHGWAGRMLGIDYSPQSISLARQISSLTPPTPPIAFTEWDLLHGDAGVTGPQPWDVVLDKGTFDAISLAGAEEGEGKRPVEAYRARLLPLLKEGGVFVITSCNWTEEELRAWFEGELRLVGRVEYPTFTFGGAKGQTITTLCFQRGQPSSQ